MIKIIISGCLGRMGMRIAALASGDAAFKIVGAVEAKNHPKLGIDLGEAIGVGKIGVEVTSDLQKIARDCDVVIEFSTPKATIEHLETLGKAKKAVVIGTTGLSDKEIGLVRDASKDIPILIAPNMSVGVNLLFNLVADAAKKLGSGYDIEIVEAHHRLKKDAPSGTALKFAKIIAEAKGLSLEKKAVYGRKGITGERPKDEIGIHAVRGGDVVGEHTIIFSGQGERIELVHRATSRDTFAKGALEAAKFVAKESSGLYGMQDVLR